MRTQTLIFEATGQALDHVPDRPVSSATWVLEDLNLAIDNAGRELGSGAATVPAASVSLTLDAAAGWTEASATKIPVSSTTGATEGPWWIEDAEGIGELVYIEGWVTDDYLRARHSLARNYASGSTIQPLEITASIADAVAAEDDYLGEDARLRIVWSYTIDGRQRVVQELVRVSRQQASDGTTADAIEFAAAYFPELTEQVRGDGELERWANLARRMLANRLRGGDVDPSRLLAGDRSVELVAFELLMIAANNGLHPGTSELSEFRRALTEQHSRIWQHLTVGDLGEGATEINPDDETVETRERAGLSFGW